MAAIALGRLLEIDPMLVKLPFLQGLISRPDSKAPPPGGRVPRAPSHAGCSGRVGPGTGRPRIRPCGPTSATALVELAGVAGLGAAVRQTAMKMLASDRPAGVGTSGDGGRRLWITSRQPTGWWNCSIFHRRRTRP